jgi:hypothetical protein
MAPPGTRVILHETPAQRGTWATHHGERGWYIGPAPEHYRNYRLYVIKAAAERICGTVEFFPSQCPMLRLSSTDTIIKLAINLIDALRNPTPAAPFAKLGEEQLAALHQLATIFQTTATQSSPRVDHSTLVTAPVPPRLASSPNAHKPSVPRYQTCLQQRLQQCNYTAQACTNEPTMLLTPKNTGTPLFPLVNAVIDPDTGIAQEYRQLIAYPKTRGVWLHTAANQFGRLAQGVKTRIKGTDTIKFTAHIAHIAVPTGRTVIYARFCANIRPQKKETQRC